MGMLYNILLQINHYISNSATKTIAEAMSDNRELLRGYFIILFHQISRSLHQPFSFVSDLLDIFTPHEYADMCYLVRKHVA